MSSKLHKKSSSTKIRFSKENKKLYPTKDKYICMHPHAIWFTERTGYCPTCERSLRK